MCGMSTDRDSAARLCSLYDRFWYAYYWLWLKWLVMTPNGVRRLKHSLFRWTTDMAVTVEDGFAVTVFTKGDKRWTIREKLKQREE